MLARLRFLTAGESHGPALAGILEGMPAGVPLDRALIQRDMARRREVGGRSARMNIEADVVDVVAGVRGSVTLGSPIAFTIANRDHEKWRQAMPVWDAPADARAIHVPRPGHADVAGMGKLGTDDARVILERASARETATRTAVGAFCRQLLGAVGVAVESHVVRIGTVRSSGTHDSLAGADDSAVRCVDVDAAARMIALLDDARAAGETLGGVFELRARGLPVGLGHYTHWDRRLSARIAEALMSIHAARAVALGDGALLDDDDAPGGRAFHDAITSASGARASNRAGGVEGGMSNGMPVVVRVAVKPLSTVPGGLPSVDVTTGQQARGHVERSDVCAVPAASIVGEAMLCVVLADALLEKFGGDTLAQLRAHMAASAAFPS